MAVQDKTTEQLRADVARMTTVTDAAETDRLLAALGL